MISVGELVRDVEAADAKNLRLTEFRLDAPAAFISFGVAPYEIHKDVAKMTSGKNLPIEFYSTPGRLVGIKSDFILAELNNCVRYFSVLFGDYPYPVFRAAFHPFGFGQGFPTMLMIPNTDESTSEGFADYSGWLYTEFRGRTEDKQTLIRRARRKLLFPPETETGIASGRLVDIGALIMGHRLETRRSGGAYTVLVYNKGALVLRMLHFLFTDPQTGDGKAFFEMMSDFVNRFSGKAASTDDFFDVVNAHVPETPLAKKYGYHDLRWFYVQWVLQDYLPSYRLVYSLDKQSDGTVMLNGTLYQEGIPDSERWFMPLPLVFTLSKGKRAVLTLGVQGKESPVKLKLPVMPEKIDLDPDLWILSEKTSTDH